LGLGVGYTIDYFAHMQYAELEDSQKLLRDAYEKLDAGMRACNRTWHKVYSVEASSDIASGIFQLMGSSVRVMWTAVSESSSGWVLFTLHFSNATPFGMWASSGRMTANNAALELNETGGYYLEITAYLTSYYVSIWDYY